MPRIYSLAYLTSYTLTPPASVRMAADLGYAYTSFRLMPNFPGAPQQYMLGMPDVLRETKAAIADTGVGVFDIELIRISDTFDPHLYLPLFDISGELGAQAINVIVDDDNLARAAAHYAVLCDLMRPFGLTGDLEFMPWVGTKTANDALRVIELAGKPGNAGILVDALHVGRSHTTLDDIRAIPRELLHYAQICDAQAGTHFTKEQLIHTARCERLVPGTGTIDVKGLFEALPADLPVSVEVVDVERMSHVSPHAWAQHCLQKTRDFLES
jgi:sugar phosphate isomerase/epimerase